MGEQPHGRAGDKVAIRESAKVLRGLRDLERDRQRGATTFQELLSGILAPESLRRREVRSLLADLIDRLLARSKELRYEDPAGMLGAAEAALHLTVLIPGRRYGARVAADLRARVLAELGNAYRVADELLAGEEALAEAASWAKRGTGDLRLTARIGDLAASLLSDQRRFDRAIEVLEHVRGVYASLGDHHLAGRAAISQAIVTYESGQPRAAILLHLKGLRQIDPQKEPTLELTAFQGLALCLIDAGHPVEARRLVAGARRAYLQDGSRLNRIRLRWLQGKIWLALEMDRRAETAFRRAKAGYEGLNKPGDAALVSLDLALLLARQGRRKEILRLAERMIKTFLALGIHREVIATLLVLRQSCERPDIQSDALAAQIRVVAAVVAEVQRRPNKLKST